MSVSLKFLLLHGIIVSYISMSVKEFAMQKKGTGYYVNRHSCFLLSYHLVLVTKYRKPVLDGDIKKLVYQVIGDILRERSCELLEINGETDHVHVMFDAGPETDLLDLVRVIKTKTARFARSRHPEDVAKHYWKPCFWTNSYFIASIGGATRETLQCYIQNQEKTSG